MKHWLLPGSVLLNGYELLSHTHPHTYQPKGPGFDSLSKHLHGLQVQSPARVGVRAGGNQSMYSASHIDVSLPPSPCLLQ